MPSLITHYLCGEKALNLIKDKKTIEILSRHKNVFNLGTQGPDILFYYRAWPWTKNEGISEVGERMHIEKVNMFFSNALKHVMNMKGIEKEVLSSYLCGYACHYALDCNAHPYVYYKTGFVRQGEQHTKEFTYYHYLFESAIDVLMLDNMLKIKPYDLGIQDLIDIKSDDAKTIGGMYEKVLKDTFNIKITGSQIETSINDMVKIRAMLQDKYGYKKNVFNFIEGIISKYPLVSSMIHPLTIKDGLDYLNQKQSAWFFPWDNKLSQNTSFYGMFNNAAIQGAEFCKAIISSSTGSLSPDKTLRMLGNNSFSTGRDCSLHLEFKYYDCIYK